MDESSFLVEIKSIKFGTPEPWLYFIVFIADIIEYNDDDGADEEDGIEMYEYKTVYVKLIGNNPNLDQASFDKEMELLKVPTIKILSINMIVLKNEKDFNDKLEQSFDVGIRKYDENLLGNFKDGRFVPVKIPRLYSLRAYTGNFHKFRNEAASVAFIKDLFTSFNESHYKI